MVKKDKYGLWIDDKFTDTKVRIGNISHELSYSQAELGNYKQSRDFLHSPIMGVWFSKGF